MTDIEKNNCRIVEFLGNELIVKDVEHLHDDLVMDCILFKLINQCETLQELEDELEEYHIYILSNNCRLKDEKVKVLVYDIDKLCNKKKMYKSEVYNYIEEIRKGLDKEFYSISAFDDGNTDDEIHLTFE